MNSWPAIWWVGWRSGMVSGLDRMCKRRRCEPSCFWNILCYFPRVFLRVSLAVQWHELYLLHLQRHARRATRQFQIALAQWGKYKQWENQPPNYIAFNLIWYSVRSMPVHILCKSGIARKRINPIGQVICSSCKSPGPFGHLSIFILGAAARAWKPTEGQSTVEG